MTRTFRFAARRGWLLLILLGGWELLVRMGVLDPLFFPPPSYLAITLGSPDVAGEVAGQVGRTIVRALAGFGLGVLMGVALCVPLIRFPRFRVAAQPLISAVYSTPRITLLPMVMLLFGVNQTSRTLLVALSTLLIIVIQLGDAVRGVNPAYVDLARNYGASGVMLLRKVYVPACLPQAFTALRLAFGRAVVLTITIELLGSPDGLGQMIWLAWQTFSIERLYIAVMLAAVLGLVCQAPFALLEKRFVPWAERNA